MEINIRIVKKCAFCKYWYDPTNSAISPKSPKTNHWEFDPNVKSKCLKKNIEVFSRNSCSKYECKL